MSLTKVTNSMIAGAVVNVSDFGAILDGTTDDFSAVQKALWHLWDQGGGTLIIPGPCAVSKRLKFDTYDFIPTDPVGGGGDGRSVSVGVYADPEVPTITIKGDMHPQALNAGNEPNSKPSGFYWVGTTADNFIHITGDTNASWRGALVFDTLTIDGGDNNTLTSTTAALDGIWIEKRCNRGCVFRDLVITKCHKTGLRYGTDDTNSNNTFSNIHERIYSLYNGEYGIVAKGNAMSFIDCNVERNAIGGFVFRKFINSVRVEGGAIQYNAKAQVIIEAPVQQVTIEDVYMEGVNPNTVGATTTAGRTFINIDTAVGDPTSITVQNCRFVFGGVDPAYDEDRILSANGDVYGLIYANNQANTDNITVVYNTAGLFYNSFYYGTQYAGGLTVAEYDSTTTRDSFNLFIDKSGKMWNNGVSVNGGTFTMTGTGFSASTTASAYYQRHGDVVTLSTDALEGTSNATTFTITGLPVAIRPASTRYLAGIWAKDNGTDIVTARISINSSGVITVFKDASSGSSSTWTATGLKALNPNGFTYKLTH